MAKVILSKNNNNIEVRMDKFDPWFAEYLKSYGFVRINDHWEKELMDGDFLTINAIKNICQIKKFDNEEDDDIKKILEKYKQIQKDYEKYKQLGNEIKQSENQDLPEFDFKSEMNLLDFQKLPVKHMISIPNTANFSIPGTGKTIMTLAAYYYLKKQNKIDQLWIIGPIPSFKAWEDEYETLFNQTKNDHVVRYHGPNRSLENLERYDLVITSFNIAASDLELIRKNWRKNNKKIFLILDESHHIKSIRENSTSGDHTFSAAMIDLGKSAERRCILTGTPIPRDLEDLWSQITFLWPYNKPLKNRNEYLELLRDFDKEEQIKDLIDFMWTRITNRQLQDDMPERIFPAPINIPMDSKQEYIYRIIETQLVTDLPEGIVKEKIKEWKKAKVIRLLQATTNPKLIIENDEDFDMKKLNVEIDGDKSILEIIGEYNKNETAPKIKAVVEKARELISDKKNVLIFTVFRGNVNELSKLLKDTEPLIVTGQFKSEIREQTYEEFKNWDFRTDKGKILIATMGSIAESVSLHKNKQNKPVCQNVIYLEKNFNGGQYMQSLYRVYRVGSDKKLPITYYTFHSVLENEGATLDCIISKKLEERMNRLYDMLDDEFITEPLSLEEDSEEYKNSPDEEFYGMNETGEDEINAVEKLIKSRKEMGKINDC